MTTIKWILIDWMSEFQWFCIYFGQPTDLWCALMKIILTKCWMYKKNNSFFFASVSDWFIICECEFYFWGQNRKIYKNFYFSLNAINHRPWIESQLLLPISWYNITILSRCELCTVYSMVYSIHNTQLDNNNQFNPRGSTAKTNRSKRKCN